MDARAVSQYVKSLSRDLDSRNGNISSFCSMGRLRPLPPRMPYETGRDYDCWADCNFRDCAHVEVESDEETV